MKVDPSVKAYLNSLEPVLLSKINELRTYILNLDDRITEYSGYGIIGYKYNKSFFYIGGAKKHIGIYGPIALIIEKYRSELKSYDVSKGTIRLPLDQPLPLDLIKNIALTALGI
ncbi:MAG: DUF1801 domain-containing protein [Acholeplasma sp.]